MIEGKSLFLVEWLCKLSFLGNENMETVKLGVTERRW